MSLRKTLTAGAAAALAAGLLGLTPAARADDPTGGPIASVAANGGSQLTITCDTPAGGDATFSVPRRHDDL